MNDISRAFGIGAVSGARSMLGLALVANAVSPRDVGAVGRLVPHAMIPAARRLSMLAAAAELVADKSARVPARTDVMPLLGRLATGALSAAAAGRSGRRLRAAAAGAAGALCAAYALYHVRRYATTRLHVPDVAAGLVEDALAGAAGLLIVRATPGRSMTSSSSPI